MYSQFSTFMSSGFSAYQLLSEANKIGHQKEIYVKKHMTIILPVSGLLFLLVPKFLMII